MTTTDRPTWPSAAHAQGLGADAGRPTRCVPCLPAPRTKTRSLTHAPPHLLLCLTAEIRQSSQGMRAAAVQVQSAEYLKPLFKMLRARVCLPLLRLPPWRGAASLTLARLLDPRRTCPRTCSAGSARSCTTCRSANTSAQMTRTCACRSATRPGPSVSPWSGASVSCWPSRRASPVLLHDG